MTDLEKHRAIDAKITQHYNKMVADSRRIAGSNYDKYGFDLLSHCLEDFLVNKSIDYRYKVAVEDNKLPNYIGFSMAIQIKSNTSPFWIKYRKDMYNNRGIYLAEEGSVEIDPLVEIEDEMDVDFDIPAYFKNDLDCVRYALTKIHWYNRTLVEEYFLNGMKYQDMHEKYNISFSSLKKDIDKGIKEIRKVCSCM
jgi:hypothetical protein